MSQDLVKNNWISTVFSLFQCSYIVENMLTNPGQCNKDAKKGFCILAVVGITWLRFATIVCIDCRFYLSVVL